MVVLSSLMQIGELSSRAGVSHRTIHYYERIGLLKPAEREGAGYRYYDDNAFQRLEKIAALKKLGLSLDEIAAVIDLYFEDASGIKGKEKVLAILEAQLAKADAQLAELSTFRRDLISNIERMKSLIDGARETR
ncbi:DNA-binding transcriptional MerR regulator [Pseudochelatococcus contaminans]|uniref:DNA-binding transcriptional MerR regulator n=1 Tax=Pseudochelatococcus contaminans TaxID=1538103 RepID=A0A7W6EGC7_9HYPH|nr:DNA-binding transcriptional MerR regulator [Pseudochelatococcus contaminans]